MGAKKRTRRSPEEIANLLQQIHDMTTGKSGKKISLNKACKTLGVYPSTVAFHKKNHTMPDNGASSIEVTRKVNKNDNVVAELNRIKAFLYDNKINIDN